MAENKFLKAARSYSASGWCVIPIARDSKNPTVKTWKEFQTRRPTDEEITGWFDNENPPNIAIMTGAISGLVVVDVDGPEGEQALAERGVPDTRRSQTPHEPHLGDHGDRRPREHRWFAHPGGTVPNRVEMLPDLDVRGDGGYAIAPPSRMPWGDYEWLPGTTTIARLPDWFADLARQRQSISTPTATSWAGVPEGQRNDMCARLAGHLLKAGAPQDETLEVMYAWAAGCVPPMSADEVARTVASIADRDRRQRGVIGAASLVLSPRRWWDAPEVEEVAWLLPPLVTARSRIWAWGDPESGKSIFGDWVAASLSRDGLKVVVISQENPPEIDDERLRRLGADPGHLTLYQRAGIDLVRADHVGAVLEAVRGADFVMIDSLTACWSGDENDNPAVTALDRDVLVPMTEDGATVYLCHNTGKPTEGRYLSAVRQGRGASAMGDKADVVLVFEETAEHRFRITQAKNRPGRGQKVGVKVEVIDLADGGMEVRMDPRTQAMVSATRSGEVAEVAEAMVEVVRAAGTEGVTTKGLRDGVPNRGMHREALDLLRQEQPPRVAETEESRETRGGLQRAKVWRATAQAAFTTPQTGIEEELERLLNPSDQEGQNT